MRNKNIFILLLIIIIILPVSNIKVKAGGTYYWTDSGIRATSFSKTRGNTIYLTSEAEIGLFSYNVLHGTYYSGYTIELTRNMDLSSGGMSWTPIGWDDYNTFMGVFDGCGYSVKINMSTTDSSANYQGFFSDCYGTIKNLCVIGTISNSGTHSLGGISGSLESGGLIYNCSSFITFNNNPGTTAGIVSYNAGTVKNCISNSYFYNSPNKGGIAGMGTVINSYWLSGTASSATYAAGTITDSYSYTKNSTTCTLNNYSSYYIGGNIISARANLVTTLNTWVTYNGGQYSPWRSASSTSENNGDPVFNTIFNTVISWSSLSFTCNQTWNSSTRTYSYSWSGCLLSFQNYSNIDVTASMTFSPAVPASGITISYGDRDGTISGNSISIPKGLINEPLACMRIYLSGKPDYTTALNNTNIGTFTLTISKN